MCHLLIPLHFILKDVQRNANVPLLILLEEVVRALLVAVVFIKHEAVDEM